MSSASEVIVTKVTKRREFKLKSPFPFKDLSALNLVRHIYDPFIIIFGWNNNLRFTFHNNPTVKLLLDDLHHAILHIFISINIQYNCRIFWNSAKLEKLTD